MRPAVVVTRSADQARELLEKLSSLGFETIAMPVLGFRTRPRCPETDSAIARLNGGGIDWVVLPSVNAARCLSELGARPPEGVRIAAQGPKTAEAARLFLSAADVLVPPGYHAEDLLGALKAELEPGSRVLICGAKEGRDVLRLGIGRLDVRSEHLYVYSTEAVPPPADVLRGVLERPAGELLFTFMSPSAVRATIRALEGRGEILSGALLAAIGETTRRELEANGLSPGLVPDRQTAEGLISAISAAFPA